MEMDLEHRIAMLRLTVMRRAGDLVSALDRRRFAENMAFVYRMEEAAVLAVLEDVLGVSYAPPPVDSASASRITERELLAVDD
jgi:hypothetical protein